MPRKGWSSLSPEYRARLEKNGISKSDYESGASIQSARGHSRTPERPIGSTTNPQFQQYVFERNKLIQRIVQHKEEWFSRKPMYNAIRSGKPYRDNPPTTAQLRQWANMTREEWLDEIRAGNDLTFFGYH